MAVNLKKMSLSELQELSKDIEKAKASLAKQNLKEARAAVEAAAAQYGFTVEEVLAGGRKSSGRKATGKAAPKYRNPDDASQTWSGRGRQPEWYKAAIKGGASPESLAI